MGKPKQRFVAKAIAGVGWRIWDNMQKNGGETRFSRSPKRSSPN